MLANYVKEKGVDLIVRGVQTTMYCTIAVISVDNLGNLALGGFKESCSAEKCADTV